jgi:hypothetical protein
MFERLPEKTADYITGAGELGLRVVTGKDMFKGDSVKHTIVYKTHFDNFPLSLFNFDLRETNQLYIVNDLIMSPSFMGSAVSTEPIYHFFLGWALHRMSDWAKEAEKSVVVVLTELSHCTEWFADLNYKILKQNEKYRGAKTVRR